MYRIMGIDGGVKHYVLLNDNNIISRFNIKSNGYIELVLIAKLGGIEEDITTRVLACFLDILIKNKKMDSYMDDNYIFNIISKINSKLSSNDLNILEEVSMSYKSEQNDLVIKRSRHREASTLWHFKSSDNNFFGNLSNIPVYSIDYNDFAIGIDYITEKVKNDTGAQISFEQIDFVKYGVFDIEIEFSIKNPKNKSFYFWNTSGQKDTSCLELYISPSYGVVSKNFDLINGATDTVIGKEIIKRCYSPEESKISKESCSSSWSYMKHPYYAKGNSFKADINFALFLNKRSCDYIVQFIISLLNKNEKPIMVSGGFNSDFTHQENIGNIFPYEKERGSESTVLWQYLTLKLEDNLKGSKIPEWFWKEKWLLSYAKYYLNKKEYSRYENKPRQELLDALLEYNNEELFKKEYELYKSKL